MYIVEKKSQNIQSNGVAESVSTPSGLSKTELLDFHLPRHDKFLSCLKDEITNDSGRADTSAITVLEFIAHWFRPNKSGKKKFFSDLLHINLGELANNLTKARSTIKRALNKLEELDFIKREYRKTGAGKYTCSNVMFVQLNIAKLRDLICQKKGTNQPHNLENAITLKTYVDQQKMNRGSVQNEPTYTNISTKEEKANSYSNLKNNDLLKNSFAATRQDPKPTKYSFARKTIEEFLPLSAELVAKINEEVERDLPQSYFNDVMRKFIKQKPGEGVSEHFIATRLIAWAKKEKASDETIKSQYGVISMDEKLEAKKDAEMLARWQESSPKDPGSKLQRSIAFASDKQTAVQILKTGYINQLVCPVLSISGAKAREKGRLVYSSSQYLSEEQCRKWQEILEKAVAQAFGHNHFEIEVSVSARATDGTLPMPELTAHPLGRKIEEASIKRYGEAVFKSWFSRVEWQEESGEGGVALKAVLPSSFMQEWFDREYGEFVAKVYSEISA